MATATPMVRCEPSYPKATAATPQSTVAMEEDDSQVVDEDQDEDDESGSSSPKPDMEPEDILSAAIDSARPKPMPVDARSWKRRQQQHVLGSNNASPKHQLHVPIHD